MRAAIITVGTELTSGLRVDTNSVYLADNLAQLGIECCFVLSVPDSLLEIAAAVKQSLKKVDVLVVTGGLGPTVDDLTRQGLAKALGKKLVFDKAVATLIKSKFKRLGKEAPAIALNQAYVLKGAIIINPKKGTAPGLIVKQENKVVFVLPGVPSEMKEMFAGAVVPYLKQRFRLEQPRLKEIKTVGEREAVLAHLVFDTMDKYREAIDFAILPHLAEVHFRMTLKKGSQKKELAWAKKEMMERLGETVYGFSGDSLELVVAKLLRKGKLTIGLAESLTGGLLSDKITQVPGSSAYFLGTVVAYSNEVKQNLLGINKNIIAKEGAVSSSCAEAMAQGVKKLLKTDIGLSSTGIAGPTGGTKTKPVGLIYLSLATKQGCITRKYLFKGAREEIKQQAATAALNLLRLYLLGKLN